MNLAIAAAFGSGLVFMTFLICAAFFWSFWRRTKDSLFLSFALAFLLLSANQGLPVLLEIPREEQSPFYLLRMAAFAIIIVAIVSKNMGGKRRG